MRETVTVLVEICREGVVLPVYFRNHDAGMDLCAAEDVTLHPMETKCIPTGLKMAIPPGYEIQIRPRSGISLKTPIRLSNAPGTIDAGYRDEIEVVMTNTSVSGQEVYPLNRSGNQQGIYVIRKGDRIAQMVLSQVPEMVLKQVSDVSSVGQDRGGGFGSTGIG